MLSTTLSETFPFLFSRSLAPNATVREVFQTMLRANLRDRLTQAAVAELQVLTNCMAQVAITSEDDTRLMVHPINAPFTSSGAYSILQSTDDKNPDAMRIWNTKLPTKIKFFGWLLYYARLNTRSHLYHCGIRALEDSMCEHCSSELETDEHLFLHCPRARAIWDRLCINTANLNPRTPWLLGATIGLPDQVHTDMLLLVFWHVWKARNSLIFEGTTLPPSETLRRVVQDCDAWKHRYTTNKPQVEQWPDFFRSNV